jgi:preprotein translocase subunit SecE
MSASEASQQANRAEMDPKRLVVISYMVFGVIIALFLGRVLDLLAAQVGIGNGRVLDGLDFKVSDVLGFLLAGGLGVWAWMNPRVHTLSSEVASELMRVTWPSFEETRMATFAVVVASLVAAVVLFSIDTFSYKLMVDWLPHLWGKL